MEILNNVRMCELQMCDSFADDLTEFARSHIRTFAHQNLFFHIMLSNLLLRLRLYLGIFFCCGIHSIFPQQGNKSIGDRHAFINPNGVVFTEISSVHGHKKPTSTLTAVQWNSFLSGGYDIAPRKW